MEVQLCFAGSYWIVVLDREAVGTAFKVPGGSGQLHFGNWIDQTTTATGVKTPALLKYWLEAHFARLVEQGKLVKRFAAQ